MTKLNTRGLNTELSRIAAWYLTVEGVEASIASAQALLEGTTYEKGIKALSGVVANLQRILAHHHEAEAPGGHAPSTTRCRGGGAL